MMTQANTSSYRAPMAHELVPHPDHPPRGVKRVSVRWYPMRDGRLMLRWHVLGAEALAVPAWSGRSRAEGLWEKTCFELFVRDSASASYAEFNFSPSGRWAAYYFPAYREGRIDIDLDQEPEITSATGDTIFVLTAIIEKSLIEGAASAALCAVIEETDGTKSYWALAHASGKPDFHDAACFALPLAAREVP